jgi:hypothetical protein
MLALIIYRLLWLAVLARQNLVPDLDLESHNKYNIQVSCAKFRVLRQVANFATRKVTTVMRVMGTQKKRYYDSISRDAKINRHCVEHTRRKQTPHTAIDDRRLSSILFQQLILFFSFIFLKWRVYHSPQTRTTTRTRTRTRTTAAAAAAVILNHTTSPIQ